MKILRYIFICILLASPLYAQGIDSNTKLMLHFDGNDGAAEVADDGNTGHISTLNGTADIRANNYKLGDHSCYFDGTDDYLTVPDSADWDIVGSSSDNWTLDLWVYSTDFTASRLFIGQYQSGTDRMVAYWSSAGNLTFYARVSDVNVILMNSNGSIPTDEWVHIALIKVGSEYGWYVNGEQTDYLNDSSTATYSASLEIGAYNSSTYFEGYMDELRIQHSNVFSAAPASDDSDTITVPTSEHSSDSNTKLLMHFNQNSTEDYLDDSGNTGHTVSSNNGAAAVSRFDSGGLFLDGNSDYITIPDSADWDIFANTADDWTIDGWFYIDDVSVTVPFLTQSESTSDYFSLYNSAVVHLTFILRTGGTNTITMNGDTSLSAGQWYHLAFVKVGTEYAWYINGDQDSYVNDSSTDTYSAALYLGRLTTNYFNGYIDELRIHKSNIFSASPVSGKTDTITVPISEHSSDTNTKLLLHFNTQDVSGDGGSGVYHESSWPATTQTDSGSTKFDNTLLLDGNSDFVAMLDSDDWYFGTGKFTFDFWGATTSNTTYQGIAQQDDGTSANRIQWFFLNSGKIRFLSQVASSNVAFYVTTNSVISDTNWHHYAFVRDGTNFYIFIDGDSKALDVTQAIGSNSLPNLPDTFDIGADVIDNYYWSGNLDEVRIQKGSAEWTADFTAPTTAYSVDSSSGTRRIYLTKFIPLKEGGYRRESWEQNFGWRGINYD